MPTTNKNLDQPALNATNWNTPLNTNFGILDAALGGTASFNVTGVGTTPVVLTTAQYQNLILNFTGTLTANVTYQIPSGVGGQWIVANNTTGAFTLTIDNVAAGASVVVPTGARRTVYSDGTNIYDADSAATNVGAAGNIAYSDGAGLTGSANMTYASNQFRVAVDDALSTGVSYSARFSHTTTGTAGTGIGSGIMLASEVPAGTLQNAAGIFSVLTDPTAGSEDYRISFALTLDGVFTGVATIDGNGIRYGTNYALVAREATNTSAQSLDYAGFTAIADDDGSIGTGGVTTYRPTPVGGNFKRISNAGAFTLLVPSAPNDYTIIVQVTNVTGAGAVTFSGYSKVAGDTMTTTVGDDFFIFVTKVNGFTLATIQALQ